MEIKPYERNAKKHPQKQIDQLAAIVKEVGWRQPILVNQQGVIVAGHGRWETYQQNKDLKEPWVIDDKGQNIMGEAETTPLTEQQEKAYRLADNKLAETDVDMGLVLEELEELGELAELTGYDLEELASDNPYTTKIETPVYETSGEKPELDALFNLKKFSELETEIKSKDIPSEIKHFLTLAAYRHIVFDYSKIADFYAHSERDVQDLMERSALVIIDYDKAIEYGFAQMSKEIEEQYHSQHTKDVEGRG